MGFFIDFFTSHFSEKIIYCLFEAYEAILAWSPRLGGEQNEFHRTASSPLASERARKDSILFYLTPTYPQLVAKFRDIRGIIQMKK